MMVLRRLRAISGFSIGTFVSRSCLFGEVLLDGRSDGRALKGKTCVKPLSRERPTGYGAIRPINIQALHHRYPVPAHPAIQGAEIRATTGLQLLATPAPHLQPASATVGDDARIDHRIAVRVGDHRVEVEFGQLR